jgi:hypothetical protein
MIVTILSIFWIYLSGTFKRRRKVREWVKVVRRPQPPIYGKKGKKGRVQKIEQPDKIEVLPASAIEFARMLGNEAENFVNGFRLSGWASPSDKAWFWECVNEIMAINVSMPPSRDRWD